MSDDWEDFAYLSKHKVFSKEKAGVVQTMDAPRFRWFVVTAKKGHNTYDFGVSSSYEQAQFDCEWHAKYGFDETWCAEERCACRMAKRWRERSGAPKVTWEGYAEKQTYYVLTLVRVCFQSKTVMRRMWGTFADTSALEAYFRQDFGEWMPSPFTHAVVEKMAFGDPEHVLERKYYQNVCGEFAAVVVECEKFADDPPSGVWWSSP